MLTIFVWGLSEHKSYTSNGLCEHDFEAHFIVGILTPTVSPIFGFGAEPSLKVVGLVDQGLCGILHNFFCSEFQEQRDGSQSGKDDDILLKAGTLLPCVTYQMDGNWKDNHFWLIADTWQIREWVLKPILLVHSNSFQISCKHPLFLSLKLTLIPASLQLPVVFSGTIFMFLQVSYFVLPFILFWI